MRRKNLRYKPQVFCFTLYFFFFELDFLAGFEAFFFVEGLVAALFLFGEDVFAVLLAFT